MQSHVQSKVQLIKYQKQDSQNTDYLIGTSRFCIITVNLCVVPAITKLGLNR